MTPLERVLDALRSRGCEPKPKGSQWQCRCPAHDDHEPSMSVAEGDDGRVLVHCFAGCAAEDICNAIGLSLADLMPPTGRSMGTGIFAHTNESPRPSVNGKAPEAAPLPPAPGVPPPKTAADAARDLLNRGIMPIPIPLKSKNPDRKGWQGERVSEAEVSARFKGEVNIGALWGDPSNWHVDVDIDDPRALAVADRYLPKTPAEWGRPSSPRSHRIYRVTRPVNTAQHRHRFEILAGGKVKVGAMIVEIRSTGLQTIAPGSTHPDGEVVRWDNDGEPALVDPEDLLKAVAALAEAVRNGEAEDKYPPPLDLPALREKYPKLRDPVLEGLLRRGEVMNIIAPPKRGKSWLVAGLAVRVCVGGKWLGTFQVHDPGRVLILDNELHLETLSDRLVRVAEMHGREISEFKDLLHVESYRGGVVSIERVMSCAAWCRKNNVRLVIIDAMYRLATTGVSENDNAAMAQLYSKLDEFAKLSGAAVVLIHHSTKGSQADKDIVDVGAGAGSQARAADTHLILRNHQESDVVVLEGAVRSWPPPKPICIRWKYPVWELDTKANPADLKGKRKPKTEESDSEWTAEAFVAEFVTSTPKGQAIIVDAAIEAGLSDRKAKRLLKIAVEEGLATKHQEGGRNTPAKYSTPIPA